MMWLIGSNKKEKGEKGDSDLFPKQINPRKKVAVPFFSGFTLVELMVTVVVVTAGLVLIIQGFTVAAGALNSMQNRILAAQFLDAKMQELEILAKYDKGVKEDSKEDKFFFEGKSFEWKLNIQAVEKEAKGSEEEGKELDLSQDLNLVEIKISWLEKNFPKDLSVSTYLRNKKI